MNYNELSKDALSIVYQNTFEDMEMRPHFHNSYEIIYIVEGKIELTINNRLYTAHNGCIIFISNLESHELKVLQYPYKRYFILLDPNYFQTILNEPIIASIFKHRPTQFNHIIKLSYTDTAYLSSVINNMYEESISEKAFKEITLRSYLSLLFIHLYRNYGSSFPLTTLNKQMETVIEIQKHVEDHFMEDLTLHELANLFYIDMYYLSHLFKKVTGFSFKEYLILQRITKAKQILFYTYDDITQVGINSGFNNVNHFIRIFKKYEGMTPYQYRKKFRG